MTANSLDSSALLSTAPKLCPQQSTLNSPQDALVLLLHSIMSALDFRLLGTDDSSSSQPVEANILPPSWSANGPGSYTLRYSHNQSSLQFVLKVTKLSDRLLINAIAIGSDRTATLDIKLSDYTSQSFFPTVLPSEQPLVHGFVSSNRVADFTSAVKLKILSNIMPGLNKQGYQEDREVPNMEPTSGNPSRDYTRPVNPTRPNVPQFPDHDPLRLPTRDPRFIPESPLAIGRSDLDPIPMHPNPFAPPSLFPQGSSGDGMFVGPSHPIFGDRIRNPSGSGGMRGPWGGDGYLPPMGAPPGARFDPIGPDFGDPLNPGGRGPRQRNGDPDNDEFMPPGARSMFM